MQYVTHSIQYAIASLSKLLQVYHEPIELLNKHFVKWPVDKTWAFYSQIHLCATLEQIIEYNNIALVPAS